MGGLGADVAAGQEAATNAADYAAYVRSCRQELERALGVAVSSALRARPACPVDAVADALSGGELSRLRAKVAERYTRYVAASAGFFTPEQEAAAAAVLKTRFRMC